jgi:hypothetical protein
MSTLLEEAENKVSSDGDDTVVKLLFLTTRLRRGLLFMASVDGKVIFPRWSKREAGIIGEGVVAKRMCALELVCHGRPRHRITGMVYNPPGESARPRTDPVVGCGR